MTDPQAPAAGTEDNPLHVLWEELDETDEFWLQALASRQTHQSIDTPAQPTSSPRRPRLRPRPTALVAAALLLIGLELARGFTQEPNRDEVQTEVASPTPSVAGVTSTSTIPPSVSPTQASNAIAGGNGETGTAAVVTTTTAVALGTAPSQPTNVRLEVFDHQTIDLYWDHDGTNLIETIVSLGCCGGVLGDERYPPNVRSARIIGLNTNITYVVEVTAVGPTGADGKKVTADPVRVEATTPAALPPAPVTNVQTTSGPNWIEVTWDHNRALLDEFVVTVDCCGAVLAERRLPIGARSYRFEGLESGVDHFIEIQAMGTLSPSDKRLGSTITLAPITQPG